MISKRWGKGKNVITTTCCYAGSHCGSSGARWELGHTECLMKELLSIFPSQIRRLSNKKIDEINNEIQQAQTSAGNCCLPFSTVRRRRQEARVGPGLWKPYPERLVLHTPMGVDHSLGPHSRTGWTLLT